MYKTLDTSGKGRRVYVAGCPRARAVKIGVSSDVETRLKDLSTGCPGHIVLMGTIWPTVASAFSLERALHYRYKDFVLAGSNEWFDDVILLDSVLEAALKKGRI